MCKVIIRCCGGRKKEGRRVRVVPRLGPVVEQSGDVQKTPQFQSRKRGETIMGFALTANQLVNVTVEFKDKKGNAATVDGIPEWLTDNSELLSLTPSPDGLSCVVAAVGPLGTATVTLRADADMGSGVVEVLGTLEVDVGPGSATVVTLTPGTPTDQP